jgi:hypothetical protein
MTVSCPRNWRGLSETTSPLTRAARRLRRTLDSRRHRRGNRRASGGVSEARPVDTGLPAVTPGLRA